MDLMCIKTYLNKYLGDDPNVMNPIFYQGVKAKLSRSFGPLICLLVQISLYMKDKDCNEVVNFLLDSRDNIF
jgi:hypothetical protein